eukprot:jgi/Mesvir1/8705/Mv02638-RA.2
MALRSGASTAVDTGSSSSGTAPLPSSWSTKDGKVMEFLEVNDLRVSYTGPGKKDEHAAAVRTIQPIPTSCPLFYYEVTIIDKGCEGFIAIGLCAAGVSMNRLPGWEKDSFGYHGDDGNCFRSSGKGTPFGPTFTAGDVIGCCFNQVDKTVLYTKNGISLGVAFRDVKGVLHPTIGLRTKGEVVEANFGAKPFKFDWKGFSQSVRDRVLRSIQDIVVPRASSVYSSLILSYLTHHTYPETSAVFARDAGVELSEGERKEMAQRREMMAAIMAGQVDRAVELTSAAVPSLLSSRPDVHFELQCQKFIEMVKLGDDDATMRFGRTELCRVKNLSASQKGLLEEVFSLLAYAEPEKSPMGALLQPSRREWVATLLNNAWLGHKGKSERSPLEVSCGQMRLEVNEDISMRIRIVAGK